MLAHATGKDEETVLSGLDELWQRRIIREYDGACYNFSHDRIRDVAYAMIEPVKRRLLHRQVAQALNTSTGITPILSPKNWQYTVDARQIQTGAGLFPTSRECRQASLRAFQGGRESPAGYRGRADAAGFPRTSRPKSTYGAMSACPKYSCMTGAANRSARPGTGPTRSQCRPIAHSYTVKLRLHCGLFTVARDNGEMLSSFPSLRSPGSRVRGSIFDGLCVIRTRILLYHMGQAKRATDYFAKALSR